MTPTFEKIMLAYYVSRRNLSLVGAY